MRRLDVFQENHETDLVVGPGNTIKQTFVPGKNNFAGVRIPLSNPKLGSSDEYLITIADGKNVILRQETVTGINLGWQYTLRYDFAPIADSAGKVHVLSFSYVGENPADGDILTKINTGFWDNQKPDEKTALIIENTQKNYVHLTYSSSDAYKDGQAIINNTPLSGDLAFETYYQVDAKNYFKDVLNDFKSHTLKDPAFFIVYLSLMTLLIILFISQFIKKRSFPS